MVNVHRCPSDYRRTGRAGLISANVEWLKRCRMFDPDKADFIKQVESDQAYMAEHDLCVACGFPLDNSAPHPDFKTPQVIDWRTCRHGAVEAGASRVAPDAPRRFICFDCGARIRVKPPRKAGAP